MLVAVNIDVIRHAAKSRLNLAIASQKIAYITASTPAPPSSSGSSSPSQSVVGELSVRLVRPLAAFVMLAGVNPAHLLLHEAVQRVVPDLLFLVEAEIHAIFLPHPNCGAWRAGATERWGLPVAARATVLRFKRNGLHKWPACSLNGFGMLWGE